MISLNNQMTFIKRSSVLIAFLCLTACSYSPDALRNSYGEMATSVSDDLKESVDFSVAQNAKIDDYASQLMQWHRRHKLPEYSQHLSKLATLISNDSVTASSLKPIVDLMDGAPHFEQSGYIAQTLAEVAQTVTSTQVDQIAASMKNEHEQTALEIKQVSLVKERGKNIRQLFMFLGVKLTAAQQHIINTEAPKFHDLRQQELEMEVKDDNDLIALLRNTQDSQFVPRFVENWNKPDSQLTGQVQQLEQANKRQAVDLLSKLIMSMDTNQKTVLTEKLLSISQTLALMANE